MLAGGGASGRGRGSGGGGVGADLLHRYGMREQRKGGDDDFDDGSGLKATGLASRMEAGASGPGSDAGGEAAMKTKIEMELVRRGRGGDEELSPAAAAAGGKKTDKEPKKGKDEADDGDDDGDEDLHKDDALLPQKTSPLPAAHDAPALTPNDRMFRGVLVHVAALEAFAHGANDTANSTGPMSAMWEAYRAGSYGAGRGCGGGTTDPWVMAIAGACVACGVVVLGGRVIQTMGRDISKSIDFHKAWCIEFATVVTVVVATIEKYPVSTTHCKVGAVVFLGAWTSRGKDVDWKLFGKIAVTWVVTIPLAMVSSIVGFFIVDAVLHRV